MKQQTLEYPFTAATVKRLKVGDLVKLTGKIYTGRDRFHQYLADGGKCPVPLKDGAIYHCGPVAILRDRQWQIRAAGPTTSTRQEPFTEDLIARHQVRVIIGKGGMGEKTRAACRRYGCIYLHAVGGAAALLAQRIERVDGVHFLKEFGMADAVWELVVRDLEAVVAIDAHGRSLQKRVAASSRRALKALLQG